MYKAVESESRSIHLPPELITFFRNVDRAKRFAIDIGGSLTKIAYCSTTKQKRPKYPLPNPQRRPLNCNLEEYEEYETPKLHFIKFETSLIASALDFIQKELLQNGKISTNIIKATGGGAYKYAELIEEKLGLRPEKENEVDCLIKGANFLLKNVSEEAFTYERRRVPEYCFLDPGPVLYPFLLVNIGSGVSVLKVDSEEDFTRIGGTATGGGTFWGLGSLLTGAKEFDELLSLAEKGDHRKVDMLVGDIYAGDCSALNLHKDLIASSFGKAPHLSPSDFSSADVARSLLFTIANDIGQIAALYAQQHSLTRIYFGGFFLRNHPLSMHAVSYAVRYWSKDSVEALFLRHEGYLGAIGAFLRGTEEGEGSWSENFLGSSGFLPFADSERRGSGTGGLELLEMDKIEQPVEFFPLLRDDIPYIPDTVNLSEDSEARSYWISSLRGSVDRLTERAMESAGSDTDGLDRALRCKKRLLDRFRRLSLEPCSFGRLSVRSLLKTMGECLRDFGFPDPYLRQKQIENSVALSCWDGIINSLDALCDEKRKEEAMWGVLAGNVFDWGAEAVALRLEGPGPFGFEEAKEELEKRPWLIDSLDQWLERLKTKPSYRCVTVFVDNAGFDFVLGILPFVREFLRQGTKVILVSNSDPALNDMTYEEMVPLLRLIGDKCDIIRNSLQNGSLIPIGSGEGSPCLDLSRISQDLARRVEEEGSDLVVLEGMGRAIHTNLEAKFRTDVLKLAVLKNGWLANQLGGNVFSVICSFEEYVKEVNIIP